jgi:formate dehydrogenase major subunit
MTNHWVDIKNADLVLIMGGNAAEAHPCGFKWVIEAKKHNNAKLLVVDPRFTRSASVADYYVPLRTGTDIAFLGGLINYLLTNDKIHHEYVKAYTDLAFLVDDKFDFDNGLFSGYDVGARKYDRSSWVYQIGADGYVKTDPTLGHPRSVYQLLKKHYSRYTPEMVEKICGTPREEFLRAAEMIASTSTPERRMTIMYALGWTQHSLGTQMIRAGAMVQLLLGNIGVSGGGMNALRGHSNIQGLTDLGLLSDLLPGYLTLPGEKETDYRAYIKKRAFLPLRPNQLSYWQNLEKFYVSLMKAWFGDAATQANDWCFDWLPRLDKPHDVLQVFEDMFQGRMNGYVCQGFNAFAAFPNKAKLAAAFAKLKYLVVMDPLETETSEFWRNFGEYNETQPSKIQTTVFRLPVACFAEEDGSLVNSGRWLQWHWKGAEPPGEAKVSTEVMARLFVRLRELYKAEGGAFPDPILNLSWPYRVAGDPTSQELAMEFSGKALADLIDPKDKTRVIKKAGEQLDGFAQLREDGTTSCGCWIFSGSWTQAGNLMARRDNSDPYQNGQTPNWAWSWPANRRILYNRASCKPDGTPWNPGHKQVWWNGKAWIGSDVPDFKVDSDPVDGMGPFIMNPEGVARLFGVDKLADGPFPEHYEPLESPVGANLMNSSPHAVNNPAVRVFPGDREAFGRPPKFPYAATTYRLTEHFHYWTKHSLMNAVLQPEQFVEIDEELAAEKGIKAGDMVRVRSNRGEIKAVALVTKRLQVLIVNGKKIHHVGIPIHWGFKGVAKMGYLANTLTPYVGDANTQTPEFKSFLVNVEKI